MINVVKLITFNRELLKCKLWKNRYIDSSDVEVDMQQSHKNRNNYVYAELSLNLKYHLYFSIA